MFPDFVSKLMASRSKPLPHHCAHLWTLSGAGRQVQVVFQSIFWLYSYLLHNTGLFRTASLLPSVKRGWPSCFVRACFWHTLFSFSLFALILFHLRKRWTFICVWCESTLTTLRMCVYVAKLFNCCNNPARDKTLPKQRLSNWIMEAIFPASHRTKGLSLPQGVSASGDWKPHVPHLKGSLWVISVLQLVGHHHTLLFWFSDNSGGIYTSLPYCMCATKWINWKRTASVPWSRGTRYKTKSPHWEAGLSQECLSNWGTYMCRRGLKYVITGHVA